MIYKRYLINVLSILLQLLPPVLISSFHNSKIAFVCHNDIIINNRKIITENSNKYFSKTLVVCNAKRYGPTEDNRKKSNDDKQEYREEKIVLTTEDDDVDDDDNDSGSGKEIDENQKIKLKSIIKEITSVKSDIEYPSILTKNIEYFLSIQNGALLFKDILEEAEDNNDREKVAGACNLIIDFISEFVDQTKSMEDNNKKLLGKILKVMIDKKNDNTLKEKEAKNEIEENAVPTLTEKDRENALDELLRKEKDDFTSAGFISHLERECARIQNAPQITPESSKLLQTLQVIHIRVIEEMGKDLGETALVLNQLLGYDNDNERYAVLEAGLMVRGIDFAEELLGVTKEALDGLKNIPEQDMVDGNLIDIIQGVYDKILVFVESKRK